jgi:hypothetical protein
MFMMSPKWRAMNVRMGRKPLPRLLEFQSAAAFAAMNSMIRRLRN